MLSVYGGKRGLALLLISAPALFGARDFSDIPGDGSIRCSIGGVISSTVPCDTSFVGTSSAGNLSLFGSTLSIDVIGNTATFVSFSGGIGTDATVGPLGLSEYYDPDPARSGLNNAQRDVTRPVTGQLLTFNVRNAGAEAITAIAFNLLLNESDWDGNLETPRPDGLTFGVYCKGMIDALDPADACSTSLPLNYALLAAPTGPGTVNGADLDPTSAWFGDLLRFSGFSLAPTDTAQFSFFVSDYKPTRVEFSGGSDPSGEFSLAIASTSGAAPIPEPGTLTLMISGGIAALLWRRRRSA